MKLALNKLKFSFNFQSLFFSLFGVDILFFHLRGNKCPTFTDLEQFIALVQPGTREQQADC
jgi:hypothetical protein